MKRVSESVRRNVPPKDAANGTRSGKGWSATRPGFRLRQRSRRLAGRIGLDTTDSHETALQKRLVVVLCAGTLPLTALWSAIYFAAGVPLAAAIPGFYSLFTPINTAIFACTRNLGFYRFTQLLTILILPWLLMMAWAGSGRAS